MDFNVLKAGVGGRWDLSLHNKFKSSSSFYLFSAFTRRVRPGLSPPGVWTGLTTCGHCLLGPMARTGAGRERQREEREERSGERALITAQQSEIRPRSEQISAELPALITHHTSALSSIHSISVIKIETIQWPGCDQCCHLLSTIIQREVRQKKYYQEFSSLPFKI